MTNRIKKSGILLLAMAVVLAALFFIANTLKNKYNKENTTVAESTAETSSADSGISFNKDYTQAGETETEETEAEETSEGGLLDRFKKTTTAVSTTLASTVASKSTQAQSTTSGSVTSTKVTSTESGGTSNYEYSYAGFNPQPADLNVADKRLILVNRDYILPDGYEPEELVHAIKNDPDSKCLEPEAAEYYNKMYLAAAEEGIYLTTVSGYRSYERQKTNFENKIQYYINNGYSKVAATKKAATIILPPGTSEHHLGLAMDIISLEQDFENTKAFAWLKENAEDYGFILRYPKDKQDITEIIYEPWHWRYVGVENARKINASGKCLEEYLGVK